MNPKYILTIAVTLMVGVILTAGVLTPVIADTSSTTISIDNEGAQWVRMAYVSDDTDYSVSVEVDGDVTITNGENVQTGSVTDMIVYADSLCSVFISDGDIILVGSNGNSTQMIRLGDSFTIERASGVLTIGDGTSVYQPSGSVEWAYVPIGTGTYGSFGAGGLQRDQTPLVAVGSFAGVGCYNNFITPDYGLVMDADVTSEYINSVKWALGLGGQDDDNAEQTEQTEQADPSPSPSLTVPDSPEPDTDGGEDPVPMDVSPETDAGDGDGDAEPTRGETEGSGGLRAVPSYSYTDGDWGYDVSSNYARLKYYLGAGGDITIPTTLGGYEIIQIGQGAVDYPVFDTSLAIGNLTITNGLTNSSSLLISKYAFYGCNITGTLQLIGNFTLNDNAFANTGIIWVDPVIENQTTWGKRIFENCTGMTGTLTVNASASLGEYCFKGTGISKIIVDKYYNSSASTSDKFAGLSNLTEIEWNCGNLISLNTFGAGSGYPSLERIILTNGRVGERTFNDLSALTHVSLTNNATISGSPCFSNCPLLTTVVLPSSITSIGSNYYTGSFNNDPLLSDIDLSHLTKIWGSFNDCPSLNFDISSARDIQGSFKASSIQTLNISVTTLTYGSFSKCENLVSVTLTDTTSLSNCFSNCKALRDVVLPNSLTSIGASFQYCGDAMKSLTIPISVPIPLYGNSSGSAFLNSASKLEHVTLLAGTGKGADYTASSPSRYQDLPWNKSKATLQDITLASGITKIGNNTFREMTLPISLPNTLVTIGDNAFYHCTGLTGTLSLPDSVTIGNYAFYQCTGLTGTLVISPSVTSVGAGAFGRCTGLTALSWPISLSSTGCFTSTNTLTSITLTGTGDSADYTESDYQTTPQYISRANLTTVTISEGVTSVGDYLLAGCSNVTSLSIPSTLTEIGDHAFYQCAGLTGTFTLPQGVTSVGDYAFDGCGYSGELDIGNIRSIGDHAFSGCTFTGTLILPAGLTSVGDNAFSDSSFDNMIVMSDATPSSDAFSGMAVRQVLNLSDTEYTKTSYGLNANEVRDEIDADSYICVVSYEETVYKEGVVYSLLPVIPLVAVAGLVIGVGVSVMRRGGE